MASAQCSFAGHTGGCNSSALFLRPRSQHRQSRTQRADPVPIKCYPRTLKIAFPIIFSHKILSPRFSHQPFKERWPSPGHQAPMDGWFVKPCPGPNVRCPRGTLGSARRQAAPPGPCGPTGGAAWPAAGPHPFAEAPQKPAAPGRRSALTQGPRAQ